MELPFDGIQGVCRLDFIPLNRIEDVKLPQSLFETAKNLGVGACGIVTLEGEIFERSRILSGGYNEEKGT